LPANAVCQATYWYLIHRVRGQARSYKVPSRFGEGADLPVGSAMADDLLHPDAILQLPNNHNPRLRHMAILDSLQQHFHGAAAGQ